MMSNAIHLEVANAARVLENELPAKQARPRRTNEVVDCARRLERLRVKARRLRRELKSLETDIRHEKKMLRALAGAE